MKLEQLDLVYNLSQTLGWAWILNQLLCALTSGTSTYAAIFSSLQIYVASSVVEFRKRTILYQLVIRGFLLWLTYSLPEIRDTFSFITIVLVWGMNDLTRYFNMVATGISGRNIALERLAFFTHAILRPISLFFEFCLINEASQREGLPVMISGIGEVELNISKICFSFLGIHVVVGPYIYWSLVKPRSEKCRVASTTKKSE